MKKKIKINKIKLKKISIILGIILLVGGVMLFFPTTLSKYSSKATGNAKIDIVFSLLDTEALSQTITLDEIIPDDKFHTKTFAVKNYQDDYRIDINMIYNVVIKATTNLPIVYELYDENNLLISDNNEIITDEYGTIFYTITSKEKLFTHKKDDRDLYTIKYKLGSTYNEEEYQDIIELLSIEINAKQEV